MKKLLKNIFKFVWNLCAVLFICSIAFIVFALPYYAPSTQDTKKPPYFAETCAEASANIKVLTTVKHYVMMEGMRRAEMKVSRDEQRSWKSMYLTIRELERTASQDIVYLCSSS